MKPMTPAELRDHNFDTLRKTLEARIAAVYSAWISHGPGTTREVAERSGIDLLSLRPRTTDLVHLGLLEMTTVERGNGVYRVRSAEAWTGWKQQQLPHEGQLQLV